MDAAIVQGPDAEVRTRPGNRRLLFLVLSELAGLAKRECFCLLLWCMLLLAVGAGIRVFWFLLSRHEALLLLAGPNWRSWLTRLDARGHNNKTLRFLKQVNITRDPRALGLLFAGFQAYGLGLA